MNFKKLWNALMGKKAYEPLGIALVVILQDGEIYETHLRFQDKAEIIDSLEKTKRGTEPITLWVKSRWETFFSIDDYLVQWEMPS